MCKTKAAVAMLKASKKNSKVISKGEFFHIIDCIGDDLDIILAGQRVGNELLMLLKKNMGKKHNIWNKFIEFSNTRSGNTVIGILFVACLGLICAILGVDRYMVIANPLDVTTMLQ